MKKHFIFLLTLSIALSLFTAFNSHMNNWLIFGASFDHLMDGTSLYTHYPEQHRDLYKYSPSFALFVAPLSILPHWLGALFWNLLGAGLFIWALIKLPVTDLQRKGIFWISLPEFIGSTQSFQSNIHMVALLLLFWVNLEDKKPITSAFHLMTSFFIKLFGILGSCLFLYSEYSWKNPKLFSKHVLAQTKIFIILAIFPALFISWDSLTFQYSEWGKLLKMDAAQSYGFSLMGIIHGFSGWHFDRLPFQIAGGISLIAAILWHRNADQEGRMLGLIALCYFMILFNHKSESSTFVIAMAAFGLHQSLIKNKKLRWAMIIFTMGCVSLLYSDLFKAFKTSVFDIYSVKAWPFIFLYPMALLQTSIKET